jgi:hypothetical protein
MLNVVMLSVFILNVVAPNWQRLDEKLSGKVIGRIELNRIQIILTALF